MTTIHETPITKTITTHDLLRHAYHSLMAQLQVEQHRAAAGSKIAAHHVQKLNSQISEIDALITQQQLR